VSAPIAVPTSCERSVSRLRRLLPTPICEHLNRLREEGKRRLRRPPTAAGPSLRAIGLLAVALAVPAAAQEIPAKADPFLAARLLREPDATVPVLLVLRPPPAPQALRVPGPEERLPRPDRHLQAMRALRSNAAIAQAGLLDALRDAQRRGEARAVEPLWIVNAVRAEVAPVLLRRLAARPDVARVYLDRVVRQVEPAPSGGAPEPAGAPSGALEATHVPEAWDRGFTGRGLLVANLDSGVQGDHPDLAQKWRGLRAPVEQAWFDPYRNSSFPVDDDPTGSRGHGTATMGLMVGGQRTVGVAFDAEWIAANIFENNQSFVSTILKGLEWATDPDGDPATLSDVPDVINGSFGLSQVDSLGTVLDTGLCDDVFDAAIDATEAAGAVLVFSAGNFNHPDPGDITAPGSSPNALAVGAVTDAGQIASFSGRGPSPCETGDRLKPNVVAPGVSVRTLDHFGGQQSVSGTSFSTPIAGAVAGLVRQKNPTLSPADVERILQDTATDLGDAGSDNTFGFGLVNAAAALDGTTPAGALLRLTGFERGESVAARKPLPMGAPTSGFFLTPGENGFRVRLTNPTAAPTAAGTATLTSRSPRVSVVEGSADLPSVPAGGETELPFRVSVDAATPPGSDLGLALALSAGGSATIPFTLVSGEPVAGAFATHDAGDVRLTVTNFGALGFWLGVTDPRGAEPALVGEGFHFPADDPRNFLFHASFLVGRSAQQVSDDLPYGNVSQSVNDFHTLPGEPFRVLEPGPVAAQEIAGAYDDEYNFEGRLGVDVRQHSYAFSEEDRRDFVILSYDVANRTTAPLANVHFGLFADWDFLNAQGDPRETMSFAQDLRLGIVQGPPGTPVLGIVALNSISSGDLAYRVLRLVDFESGGGTEISEADKFDFLSGGVVDASEDEPQDLAHVLGFGPRTIAPGDSFQAAFAFVAGHDVAEIRDAAVRARTTYETVILGHQPPPGGIPDQLTLAAPFPNPLLSSSGTDVTIGFGVPTGDLGPFEPRPVTLRIVDVRGRIVRSLTDEELAPGTYERSWDGRDADGRDVPSGVYAVLVETGSERELKKLVVVR
jgi:bacillopeptidase F